ncbi:MAG: siroheme synthase CysG [Parvularculaceae bacterium]
MQKFPIFLSLKGRKVVVVGEGEAAATKTALAEAAGAQVATLAPSVLAGEDAGGGDQIAAVFAGAALAFIAVEDRDAAGRLAAIARGAGVLVNVIDQPALCDFTTPSIVDRGEVVIAISTGGAAPVLARRLREKIEAMAPSRLSTLAAFSRRFRAHVAARIAPARRRAFWEKFFDGDLAANILAGDAAGAEAAMVRAIDLHDTDEEMQSIGVVHIVGAGPGDADLLTLRAHRLLQDADVIFYDRLVGPDVLALARRDVRRFYVGKAKSDHAVPQSEIEARMIAFARKGKTVVRLKGGDPFVFGRGGEELAAMRAAGVPAFVTPGVTAAIGCAAAAGAPLTHRDHAQAVTFVTGHAKSGREPDLDWRALAALGHTLAVYMGVGASAVISCRLIEAGRAASTPVVIIEKGATPTQKVIKTRLGDLPAAISAGAVDGPAILIIGEVAALADGLPHQFFAVEQELAA